MGGTDDKDNLVKLTAREHYIAHLLLVKITETNNDPISHGKMLYAFNCMRWGRSKGRREFRFNSRLYQRLRHEYAEFRSRIMKSSDNPHRGTIWIYSEELRQNKKWDKEMTLPVGWKRGRVMNWK